MKFVALFFVIIAFMWPLQDSLEPLFLSCPVSDTNDESEPVCC